MFEESLGRKITWSSWRHRFPQAPLSKCFPSTLKLKPDFFKFLHPFEERFQRAAFSWRISADGRPNHRNKSWVLKFLRRKTHIFLWRHPNSKEKVVSNKVIANRRFSCIRTLFYQLTLRIYTKERLGNKTPVVNTKWHWHLPILPWIFGSWVTFDTCMYAASCPKECLNKPLKRTTR